MSIVSNCKLRLMTGFLIQGHIITLLIWRVPIKSVMATALFTTVPIMETLSNFASGFQFCSWSLVTWADVALKTEVVTERKQ